jgi:hypothetical protein
MKFLSARQWELSQQRNAVVDLLDAAAVLDEERGKASLTQFYKKVVVPWARQQNGGTGGAQGGDSDEEGAAGVEAEAA